MEERLHEPLGPQHDPPPIRAPRRPRARHDLPRKSRQHERGAGEPAVARDVATELQASATGRRRRCAAVTFGGVRAGRCGEHEWE
jgi:hypothetical protein